MFVLAAAALASPSSKADATTTTKLRRDGISITLPKGWHGRIYRRAGGLPIVQAGNSQLPASDDDVGTKAIKRMRADSIFFVLLESERSNVDFPYPRPWFGSGDPTSCPHSRLSLRRTRSRAELSLRTAGSFSFGSSSAGAP